MPTEHLDVLVVGAGISGICAGYHLQQTCPGKSYAILEARETIGGTWDLFRYPGIRSDSDMFTLGFPFRPWRGDQGIADGGTILQYVRDTATEFGIDEKIRFRHRVVKADWSSETDTWTVTVRKGTNKRPLKLTCNFLIMCSGYYRYSEGYTPDFPSLDRFAGTVIHPQHWPEDLDYRGKRVVVIGSGATAMTLVPSMAEAAGHVTMLQRSPTYVLAQPDRDAVAGLLGKVLPDEQVFHMTRWKNVLLQMFFYEISQRRPRLVRRWFRHHLRRQLGRDFDIDTHFNPSYNPWDQRVCLVPNGDLFRTIRSGDVGVVTDHIKEFTPTGIRLQSGKELEADIIVTATGLELVAAGGAEATVDGEPIRMGDLLNYRGAMLSGIPNLGLVLGYTNASWTLKADLSCDFLCRLIRHMDDRGYTHVVPVADDPDLKPEPLLNLDAGYIRRAMDRFPKQGDRRPWKLYQNYLLDYLSLRLRPLVDGTLRFGKAGVRPASAPATGRPRPAPRRRPSPRPRAAGSATAG